VDVVLSEKDVDVVN